MKQNLSILLFVVIALFLANRFFPVKKYRQVTGIEVDGWKTKLIPCYFIGEVVSIKVPENKSKLEKTIYLKIRDTSNMLFPDSCEYFKIKNGLLLLTAHGININTGPHHKIVEGDILTKFKNSDSISVCTGNDCCKFYFPLFDGLGSKHEIKMEITGKSLCP